MNQQKEFINTFFTDIDFRITNSNDYNYSYYIEQLNELKSIEQIDHNEIIDKINSSNLKEIYLSEMNYFNIDILYKSYIHGINHNIRVSLFVLIISIYENINPNDFKIILDGAKYHDIGRNNDLEDKEHGFVSSNMLDFIKSKYNNEEFNILKTIIIAHSVNDNMFEEIAKENKVQDIERCKKLFKILKDADGLDRVRLEYPIIKIDFLRKECSKHLILFAYDLINNYNDFFRGVSND